MRWPWQQHVYPNRATLTLLPPVNGSGPTYVLGMPYDTTKERLYEVTMRLQEAADRGTEIMVFDFPIDVIDKRLDVLGRLLTREK